MASTFLDLFAAKVALQLGLLDAPAACAALQAIDQGAAPDLPTVLARTRGAGQDVVARVDRLARRCMFLKGEAVYLRLLRERKLVDEEALRPSLLRVRQVVERDLRLGGLLVEQGRLAADADRELAAQAAEHLERDNQVVTERFRKAAYAGIDQNMQTVAEVIAAADGAALASASTPSRPLAPPPRPGPSPESTFGLSPGATPLPPEARPPAPAPSSLTESAILADSSEKTAELGEASKAPPPFPVELARTGLQEKYVVVRKLGEGGMGAVWLAFARDDAARERPMALKVVLDVAKTADASARMKREILATSFCAHESVIEIYDAAETQDGSFYMAMEYLPGDQLDEVLKREGPLPLPRFVDLLEQILEGLEAIHRANIVHRDVKPQNFRVWREPSGRERVKIMDFGIARVLDAEDSGAGEQFYTTMAGKITGSPAYIAPESITEPTIDQRADLYSLGIAIVRVTTGRLPFVAKDPNEFLPMHLYKKPPLLRELLPEAPVELEAFVARLLEKAPSKRTPSATAALAELRETVRPAVRRAAGLPVDEAGPTAAAPAPVEAPAPIAAGAAATGAPAVAAVPAGFEVTAADPFGAPPPIVVPAEPTPAPAAPGKPALADTADELEPAKPTAPPAAGSGFADLPTRDEPASAPAGGSRRMVAVVVGLLVVGGGLAAVAALLLR